MANSSLHVELLQHTKDPALISSLAAKLCYSKSDINDLKDKVSENDQQEFVSKLINMGHLSVFEHISFTFGVEGVSRALTHQLVRHRVASYSQQSQRYVKASEDFNFITPPSIAGNEEASEAFSKLIKDISSCYSKLSSLNIPAEDARYILPNACETKIIITMNARELLHFFSLRCCNRAQWEIRALADKMLELAYLAFPAIFEKAGPSCIRGKCSEGSFTCKEPEAVRNRIAALKKH